MGLHADPVTAAERFARHLETNYGLQLDAARHQALIGEINAAFTAPSGPGTDPISASMEFTAPKARKIRKTFTPRQEDDPDAA